MTYAEQLRHPKWQRRRLEIMSRDGFRCTRCTADDKTLNVHHTLYRNGAAPWEYADHELVTLCEDCHEAEHHPDIAPRAELAVAIRWIERYLRDDFDPVRLVREQDIEWRRAHPSDAAAFDAAKARQLAGLRAIG